MVLEQQLFGNLREGITAQVLKNLSSFDQI